MNPRITIVTVCYNAIEGGRRETFLQNMQSVQDQKDVTLEHLIIDGASKDGTLEMVRDFAATAKKHPIEIVSEPDKGIYDAMNKGIRLAKGEYIAFLNTDDFYHHAEGMKRSLETLDKFNCAYSFAAVNVLNNMMPRNPNLNPCFFLKDIFRSPIFSHQSMLVKTDVMKKLNGFDMTYKISADYDFVLRLILEGYQGCYVDLPFATYRMGGMSKQYEDTALRETGAIYARLFNKYFGSTLTEEEGYIYHATGGKLPKKEAFLKDHFRAITSKAFLNETTTPPVPWSLYLIYILKQLLMLRITDLKNFFLVIFNSRFSRTWYITSYMSGNETGCPAAAHYLHEGWKKGYDPSPFFLTNGYLKMNPDVAQMGICPLVHYKLHGKKEHRKWIESEK